MGRMHIDTLKEFTSAKSQERVGKDVVSVKNETMADVRRSDVKARKPHNSKTYRYEIPVQVRSGCEERTEERTS
jgi:hypothetical protein